MKHLKIIAIILAIVCAASLLVSCDLESLEGIINGEKAPETPKEYFEYSHEYMQSHPYKQTTVTTSVMNGISSTNESISHMDGDNYYMEDDGMISTYYNGTLYVESVMGKKKMNMSIWGDEYAMVENYLSNVSDSLKNEDITLTKNADGTTTLEFSISIDYAGVYDYVVTLDKENRVVAYFMTNELSVMGYTVNTTYESTIEYGEQYKVSLPEDADSYKEVNSIYDLVG